MRLLDRLKAFHFRVDRGEGGLRHEVVTAGEERHARRGCLREEQREAEDQRVHETTTVPGGSRIQSKSRCAVPWLQRG